MTHSFQDPVSKKTGNSLAVWIFFCIFVTDNIWLVSHYYGMDTDNMLSVLESYTFETTDDVAMKMAEDFRRRRIEKNLTREQLAEKAQIPVSNIVRFEQKGLISL